MNLRKLKKMRLSTEMLLQMLGPQPARGAVSIVSEAIPANASILLISLVDDLNTVEILLTSEDFREMLPGEFIPHIRPTYRQEAIGT
jgi:hypothetical protein